MDYIDKHLTDSALLHHADLPDIKFIGENNIVKVVSLSNTKYCENCGKKYKKEMFLDKYKLLCTQLIPISSNAKKKKQKSNRAVASGNKSLFIAWIYIECSFLSIVAKSNSLQLNVDNYIETNQWIDIDYRYTLLAKF